MSNNLTPKAPLLNVATFIAALSLGLAAWSTITAHQALEFSRQQHAKAALVTLPFSTTTDCQLRLGPLPEGTLFRSFRLTALPQNEVWQSEEVTQLDESLHLASIAEVAFAPLDRQLLEQSSSAPPDSEWGTSVVYGAWDTLVPMLATYSVERHGAIQTHYQLVGLRVLYRPIVHLNPGEAPNVGARQKRCRGLISIDRFATWEEAQEALRAEWRWFRDSVRA